MFQFIYSNFGDIRIMQFDKFLLTVRHHGFGFYFMGRLKIFYAQTFCQCHVVLFSKCCVNKFSTSSKSINFLFGTLRQKTLPTITRSAILFPISLIFDFN